MRRILSADVSVRWRRNQNAQIQQEALHHGHFSLRLNRAPDQQYPKRGLQGSIDAQRQYLCAMATRTNKHPTSSSATNTTSQPTPLESLGAPESGPSSETRIVLGPSAPKKAKPECRWSRGAYSMNAMYLDTFARVYVEHLY